MRKLFRIYLEKPELAGVALLVLLTLLFQLRSNGVFLSAGNLRGILGLLPEAGLVTIGVAILMICGEFDLSVGSTFALMPVSIALMTNSGVPFMLAMLLGLGIAAVVGFVNGFLTLTFNIPSFITTLGMLFIVRSLTVVLTGGFPPLLSSELPVGVFTQFVGPGGVLRASFLWFAGIALIAWAVLSGSNLGNWIQATGGFFDAAAALGVPVWRVKMTCFVICSTLAGFAGTIQVFRLGSPLPSIGDG
ncbi:MAG: ABC transporter permease, partial [Verrucomicrobia bacterium]|nr:ABC transporter permease [Verrucomicrobiota bacterium]